MYNKVVLMGNVGQDPETRHLESGAGVTTFSLATSEKYKTKDGEKKEVTTWHNIVLWRGLSDIAEKYVKKGDKIMIEGKIANRSYEDKDGNTKYITEIVASEMKMLSSKSSAAGGGTPSGGEAAAAPATPAAVSKAKSGGEAEDDLPF